MVPSFPAAGKLGQPFMAAPHKKANLGQPAGNITADGVCSPTPCWSFDDAGQLTAGNGASYLYDAVGRRQQKTDAGGTVRSFVFDGNSPFTEYSPSFTRATGGFFTYANGTTYFNRADNLGTPRLSTDYTGAVQRTEGVLMGPFGDDFTETLSTLDFTGFAGGFWDSENNGDHFGAREYQKTHGSWLSPDPAGMAAVNPWNPQTWNRYAYVTNSPVTYNDPSGLIMAMCNSAANRRCANYDPSMVGVSGGAGANWNEFDLLGMPVGGSGSIREGNFCLGCAPSWLVICCVDSFDGGSGGGPDVTPTSATPTPTPTPTTCTGQGRGLAGNTALVGKQGGIPGQTVQPGTAAVIPQQFGVPSGAALAPYAGDISGTIGQTSFSAVTDVIGGKSPIPGTNVRTALQQLFPGQLILEIPGASDQGANAPVSISMPQGLGCPTGTSPAGVAPTNVNPTGGS